MMNGFKYYTSGTLFVVLCLLDAFFGLMLLAVYDKGAGPIVFVVVFLALLLLATKKCYSYHKKIDYHKKPAVKSIEECCDDEDECDESIGNVENYPEYEITYTDLDGERTKRKISVMSFDGKVLESYCFLRGAKRSFYIKRISECVDLSTGEVVSADLYKFFADKFHLKLKPCDMYDFKEWSGKSYSDVQELPDELNGFELNEKIVMTIVTYKEGSLKDEFTCEKVFLSSYDSDQFYISMSDSKGEHYNVGLSKIVSVDGVDNFAKYLERKFYASDYGKAIALLQKYSDELSILIYLGRADASLTAAKRTAICNYLNSIGADASEDVFARASRRIKVETNEFKKIVNSFSKIVPEDRKKAFLDAAELVIGGRAKAKPFGLAGLQYIESKIKI